MHPTGLHRRGCRALRRRGSRLRILHFTAVDPINATPRARTPRGLHPPPGETDRCGSGGVRLFGRRNGRGRNPDCPAWEPCNVLCAGVRDSSPDLYSQHRGRTQAGVPSAGAAAGVLLRGASRGRLDSILKGLSRSIHRLKPSLRVRFSVNPMGLLTPCTRGNARSCLHPTLPFSRPFPGSIC
jgi:hypothetical protein